MATGEGPGTLIAMATIEREETTLVTLTEGAAVKISKLMAEELPELVEGYKRVPEGMRRAERNGSSPDRQLVEGLQVVDEELARLSEQIVSGDLNKLATQGRYLELKYRGEDGETR